MQLKKTIAGLLVAAVSLAVPAKAVADDAWQGKVNFDPAVIPTAKGATTQFQIGLEAYKQVHPYVALGFGAALQENWKFKSGWAFPVFVTAHAEQFGAEFTPTFDFRVGYAFSTQKFDYSSVFINPVVGIRYQRVGVGIGYLGGKANFSGSKWESNINIRLAYYFGYHATNFSRSLTKTNFGLEFALDVTGGGDKYLIKPSTGYGINLFFLYPVTENLEMGPMVGVHNQNFKYYDTWNTVDTENPEWEGDHSSLWIPIALRTRYNVRQATFAGKIYPWARLDLGGYAVSGDEMKGGFYWSPAVGLSLDLKDGNHSLDLGVGYTSLKAYKGGITPSHAADIDLSKELENETRSFGAFQVTLGYKF